MNSRSVSRETAIEDAIIAHPDRLGFPSAAAIRNVRVGWGFGRIDVMLLPPSGSIKLGLVEAKHHGAPDAICKVIGQLLMYDAGSLSLGAVGLDCLRRYADEQSEKALGVSWISPKELTGGVSPPAAAWKVMQAGEKLQSHEIKLFIAVDSYPHEALRAAVRVLDECHDVAIGLLIVEGGIPRLLTV